MKKILFSFLALSIGASAFSQAPESYKKRPTLVFNGFLNDFTTASRIKASSLSSVLNNSGWAKISETTPGIGLQYLQGLNEHIDVNTRLDLSFVDYPFPNRAKLGTDKGLAEVAAGLNFKLLSDKYVVNPYLHTGVGASVSSVYWGAYIPVGAGLQFNLGKENTFLFSDFQYRIGITELVANHLNYSLGLGTALVDRKVKVIPPPPPPPAPMDTDKDGIFDDVDKCPTVVGVAKYQGCPVPDTDKDGINDDNDKCPTVVGVAKYQGCPVPDTDKDGINDEEDKCPTVAGVAKYQGCPIPDTDGDGVNDELDKCPNEVGPASNNGCPEKAKQMQSKADLMAKDIYFQTGSDKLVKKSYASATAIFTLLNENSDLGIDILGHTDNTGKAAANKTLSQKRANAVKAYLVKKGIDASRINAEGYGDAMPIADNKTAAGKAKNRRVELKLKQL